jgi:hypothetical protein
LQEEVLGETPKLDETPRVRFQEPIDPRKISIDGRKEGYDICKDVSSAQANITIGELPQDNLRY